MNHWMKVVVDPDGQYLFPYCALCGWICDEEYVNTRIGRQEATREFRLHLKSPTAQGMM